MVDAKKALPGRAVPIVCPGNHFVNGRPLSGPFPDHLEQAVLGLGCFWGAERHFWQLEGVWVTAVGYSAGITPNPTYQEVCSGLTGHNEVVLVVYDPQIIAFEAVIESFFENHKPTEGMRQGNDQGTQYRSGIYGVDGAHVERAKIVRRRYQQQLSAKNLGDITTEILTVGPFYYAEEYHQQYLAKNPSGYCNLGGLGVCFAAGHL